MKLKNIAVVSALVAGNLFAVVANATTIYSGSPGVLNMVGPPNAYSLVTGLSLSSGDVVTYSFIANYSGTISGTPSVYFMKGAGSPPPLLITNVTSTAATYSGTFTLSSAVTAIYLQGSGNVGQTVYTITNLSLTTGTSSSSSVDLTPNAYALRSVYNVQSAALNAGLSYDCSVFDKEGMCLSTGGRYSVATSPETTTTSGLLIGSYKYDKNVRLGAWVDQNLSVKNVDGIKLSNSQPLFGVFGVWSERNDGLGYEVKVSAGYGDKDVTVTRTSTNEGSSKIQSRGIQTVSSYGISIDGDWIAAPYVGVKYTSLKRGSYVEGGSSGALTYDTLRQETTAALAGVKFTGKIDPQTFAVVSAGVETDLSTNNGQYSAGSSNTIVFNANPQRTRPVVSAGVYYDIDKTQRLGVNATVRQEAFESTSSTSVLATYTVGF